MKYHSNLSKSSIKQIFPNVINLHEYLKLITREQDVLISNKIKNYKDVNKFLHQVQILPEDASNISNIPNIAIDRKSILSQYEKVTLNDIINRFIAQLIRIHHTSGMNFRDLNCLALGYRWKSSHCETEMRSFMDIECYYVNTLHSFIYMTPWIALAEQYGELILRHILSRPAFIPTINGSYIQISGTPISTILHKSNTMFPPPSSSFSRVDSMNKYGNTEIPRYTIFYKNGNNQRSWKSLMKTFSHIITIHSFQLDSSPQIHKTDQLTDEIFGLLQSCFHNGSNDDNEKKFIRENFRVTLFAIVQSFYKTNITEILQLYCPVKDLSLNPLFHELYSQSHLSDILSRDTSTKSISRTISKLSKLYDSSDSSILINHRKRTRRGTRAGKHAKRRKSNSFITENMSIVNNDQVLNIMYSKQNKDMTMVAPTKIQNDDLFPQPSMKTFDSSFPSAIATEMVVPSSSSSLSSNQTSTIWQSDLNVSTMPLNLNTLQSKGIDNQSRNTNVNMNGKTNAKAISFAVGSTRFVKRSKQNRKIDHKKSKNNQNNQHDTAIEPTLFGLSCNHDKVSNFIKSICRRCFPIEVIWGKRRNMNRFLRAVDKYIRLGKGETMTVHQILLGIKVKSLPWISSLLSSSSSLNIDLSQIFCQEKLNYLASRWIYWIFTSFINPLITMNFYVTEGEGLGTSLLYYRKPVWNKISELGCDQIKKSFHSVIPIYGSSNFTDSSSSNTMNEEYVYKGHGLKISEWWIFPSSKYTEQQINEIVDPSNDYVDIQNCMEDMNHIDTPKLKRARTNTSSITTNTSSITTNTLEDFKNNVESDILSSSSSSKSFSLSKDVLSNIPTVRFVPKKLSVRAITNMRKCKSNSTTTTITTTTTQSSNGQFDSTRLLNNNLSSSGRAISVQSFVSSASNSSSTTTAPITTNPMITQSALYNCLHIFRQIYNVHPYLIGFGVLGLDEIYLKMKSYRLNLFPKEDNNDNNNIQISNFADCKNNENSYHSMNFQTNRLNIGVSSASNIPVDKKTKLKQKPILSNESVPKFYMAVLDLEKCYDNVDTTQLYNIMKHIINKYSLNSKTGQNQPFYSDNHRSISPLLSSTSNKSQHDFTVHKYSVSHCMSSLERVVTKNVRYVTQSEENITFRDASKEIAKNYRNSIVADGVVYAKLSESDILHILHHHLFAHIVQLPSTSRHSHSHPSSHSSNLNSLYTQVKGIPQGSILSPILCNFYYGSAETEIFGSDDQVKQVGLNDGRTTIIRLMDDYIVISTDRDCVSHFLQRAHNALKPYGGGVNPLKTTVNFDIEIEYQGEKILLNRILPQNPMPWCGFLIDTNTLEISPSYSRLLDRPLSVSFALPSTHAGVSLRRMMKNFVRMKCHALVLDGEINSLECVIKTVYGMFLVAALRTMSLIEKMPGKMLIYKSTNFLVRCIEDAISFGSNLIQSRMRYKLSRRLFYEMKIENDKISNSSINELNKLSIFQQAVSKIYNHKCYESFSTCTISIQQASWLGYRAFMVALNIKKSLFSVTIDRLSYSNEKLQRIIGNQESIEKMEKKWNGIEQDILGKVKF